MKFRWLSFLFIAAALIVCRNGYCQKEPAKVVAGIPVNYNEDSVGPYILPGPLLAIDGKAINNTEAWFHIRRPEIIRLYEENQFGRMPPRSADLH
jgi:hypothetical protein